VAISLRHMVIANETRRLRRWSMRRVQEEGWHAGRPPTYTGGLSEDAIEANLFEGVAD
jgi:hypothetical protein